MQRLYSNIGNETIVASYPYGALSDIEQRCLSWDADRNKWVPTSFDIVSMGVMTGMAHVSWYRNILCIGFLHAGMDSIAAEARADHLCNINMGSVQASVMYFMKQTLVGFGEIDKRTGKPKGPAEVLTIKDFVVIARAFGISVQKLKNMEIEEVIATIRVINEQNGNFQVREPIEAEELAQIFEAHEAQKKAPKRAPKKGE